MEPETKSLGIDPHLVHRLRGGLESGAIDIADIMDAADAIHDLVIRVGELEDQLMVKFLRVAELEDQLLVKEDKRKAALPST